MMSEWSLRNTDSTIVQQLVQSMGMSLTLAQCLVGKNVTSVKQATEFLKPHTTHLRPPVGMIGIESAVIRLCDAIKNKETIGVFGDYDVDGVTTTALFVDFLSSIGACCVPLIAQRDSGYGFSLKAVEHFVQHKCSVVIVGDCGTSDFDSLDVAKKHHIDVIVVDHHTVPSKQSSAFSLINPHHQDSTFPFKGMASVGLAFYLAASIRTQLQEQCFFDDDRPSPNMRELLDLVAIGTVADLVPLVEENRCLASVGLTVLEQRKRHGIMALLDHANIGLSQPVNAKTIGWTIGPRLNAPGRLGDAKLALDILLARTVEEGKTIASCLEDINKKRQELQEDVWLQALPQAQKQSDAPSIVVWGKGWASGVTGIIASRLVDQYQKPVFVIAFDSKNNQGRGSARSFGGVNLYQALETCSEYLERFGGHAAAAGMSIDEQHLEKFITTINQTIASQTFEKDSLFYDAQVCFDDVNATLVSELEQLAPFGKNNENVLLLCKQVLVLKSTLLKNKHLKLVFCQKKSGESCSGIAFSWKGVIPKAGDCIDLVFSPEFNVWRGRKEIEWYIRDIVLSDNGSR